jgi:hypothetical protein
MTNSKRAWIVTISLILWTVMAQFVISDERAAGRFSAESLRSAADYLRDRNGHAPCSFWRSQDTGI